MLTEIINYISLGYLISIVSVILLVIFQLGLIIYDVRTKKNLNNFLEFNKSLEKDPNYDKNKLHYLIPYYGLFELIIAIYNVIYYFKYNDLSLYYLKTNLNTKLF